MKVNYFMLLLSFMIAGLMGYAFYAANANDDTFRIMLAIVSGITGFLSVSGILVISGIEKGTTTNYKILSILFFIVFLIINIIFAVIKVEEPMSKATPYIIISSFVFIAYIIIFYGIYKSMKKK